MASSLGQFVTDMEQKMKLREQLVPVVGFMLITASAFVYQRIEENRTSVGGVVLVIVFSVLVYILLLTLYMWFYVKPYGLFQDQREAYDRLLIKIKAAVDKLIQRQRFIDQSILSVIEGEAQNIWVVTTKLENELKDPALQNAVKGNLEQGKRYTYFLPHPDAIHFQAVKRNLGTFMGLELYKKYKGQIEFIHLPLDTQFLLEEVVIYNPEQPENKNDETKGINGFTYYEAKDTESETLHMKIEGNLLRFLADRLYEYLKASGLKFAVERVLTEFAEVLADQDKLYLVQLLTGHRIPDNLKYAAFIKRLNASEATRLHAGTIDQMLGSYKSHVS